MSGRTSANGASAYGVCKFPHKLWTIINDCQSGAISWGKNGHTVVIHEALFHQQYLDREPHLRIFKTANFDSFVRSLNLYGFRKVSNHQRRRAASPGGPKPSKVKVKGPHLHEFQCELFLRGRPDLLVGMRRKVGVKVRREEAARTKVRGLLEEEEGGQGVGETGARQERPAAPVQPPAPAAVSIPAPAPVRQQICQNGQWYELLESSSPRSMQAAATPTKPAAASTTGGSTWVRVPGPPRPPPTQPQPQQPFTAQRPVFHHHHPGAGDCGAERGQPPAWVSGPQWPGPGGDNGPEAFTVLQEEDGTTRIGEKEFHNLVNAISDVIRQNPDAWGSFLRHSGISAQPLPVSRESRVPLPQPHRAPAWQSHLIPSAPPCTIAASASYPPPQHWPPMPPPPPAQQPLQGPAASVSCPILVEGLQLETQDPLRMSRQPQPQPLQLPQPQLQTQPQQLPQPQLQQQPQPELQQQQQEGGGDWTQEEEEGSPPEEDCSSPISVV